MTDFTNARNLVCDFCGTPFCDAEGPECDCYSDRPCPSCGEAVSFNTHECPFCMAEWDENGEIISDPDYDLLRKFRREEATAS